MTENIEKVISHDNKLSSQARSGYHKQLSELAERKARYSKNEARRSLAQQSQTRSTHSHQDFLKKRNASVDTEMFKQADEVLKNRLGNHSVRHQSQ
jgi:hypothetical protein